MQFHHINQHQIILTSQNTTVYYDTLSIPQHQMWNSPDLLQWRIPYSAVFFIPISHCVISLLLQRYTAQFVGMVMMNINSVHKVRNIQCKTWNNRYIFTKHWKSLLTSLPQQLTGVNGSYSTLLSLKFYSMRNINYSMIAR